MPVPTQERSAIVASDYTAINVSHEAREDLRVFAATATGLVRRRVTMTDALRLAVRIASAHLEAECVPAWESMQATDPNGAE